MKLSISNIAWLKEDDEEVYALMKQYGFTGLDIAPARIFEHPFEVTEEEGATFRKDMHDKGFEIVGMQSLLYGSSGLAIFESIDARYATIAHLKKMIDYAAKIGIKVLVFGSPKNRIIGDSDYKDAEQIAIGFFNELGEYADNRNISFCVEPNPKEYGTDFLTNTKDAANFVRKVNNKGFRLHVDLGTMLINHENITTVMEEVMDVTKHIHISHPYLDLVGEREEKHVEFASILRKLCYNGYVVIEMKNGITTPNTVAVKQALEFVSRIYGGRE